MGAALDRIRPVDQPKPMSFGADPWRDPRNVRWEPSHQRIQASPVEVIPVKPAGFGKAAAHAANPEMTTHVVKILPQMTAFSAKMTACVGLPTSPQK